MATIKVKLRPSSVPGKAGTIVYQLIHRRKVRLLTTGIHVLPRYWDAASGGISGGPSSVAQSLIDSDVMLLRSIVGTFEHTGRPYTVDDIASRFHTGIAKPTFVSFMEQEIRLLADGGKLGTARNCRNTLASFTAFLQGRPLPFSALTAELVDNYSRWLSRRGLSRNSVSFYMRVLRSVYNKAVGQQLAVQIFPFRNVYTGIDRTRKRAVPESVIARLLALDLPACSSLAFARDLFIFSYCMRGMAFVDMAYLRRTSIRGSHLRYFRHKTGQPLEIRLEKIPRNIVDRYYTAAPQSPYVFPILKTEESQAAYRQYQTALRYYNRQLKRLSALLRLKSPLSSYISRHSWATAARNHNIPLSIISAGMGHTSEKTTRIYLASLDNAIIDDANRKIINYLGGITSV